MNILLTGSTGFIGSSILKCLSKNKHFQPTIALRTAKNCFSELSYKSQTVGGISSETDWSQALMSQEIVIHAAARAHILKETSEDLIAYKRVNVDGTLNLALQAARANVKRFIFISSIGVNGNSNKFPFKIKDTPQPVEPYALSKWEAEQGLWKIHKETGMEIVIIRPPLVYGPNAKGNFGKLVQWIQKGIPLPLGCISNKRTLVGIDNLVDLIINCIDHPAAANQMFLAGDNEDLSTPDLLRAVAKAMGKPLQLIPVPTALLRIGAALAGKNAMAKRLLNSLQVDISHTCKTLGWTPPYTIEEGLYRCFHQTNE